MKYFVTLILIVCLVGCGGGASPSPAPSPSPSPTPTPILKYITIVPGDATSIDIGTNLTFHATAHYSDGSTQDVTQMTTWTSSVPSVASITLDSTGSIVTGLTPGLTVIEAVFDGKNYGVNVTVTVPLPPPSSPPPTPVLTNLSPITGSPALTVQSGNPSAVPPTTTPVITLTTTGLDQFGQPIAVAISEHPAIWNTNSPNATLIGCSDGSLSCHVQMATCVSPCSSLSALVTVILQNGSGNPNGPTTQTTQTTLMVTSAPPPPPSIPTHVSITPANATISTGGTQQFTATVTDQNGVTINQPVIWSSTMPVTQSGVVTGVNSGSTTIPGTVTATVSGTTVSQSVTFSVSSAPSVQDHCVVTPTSSTVFPGDTKQLTVTMFDQYNNPMSAQYSSGAVWNATGAISVSDGLVTAVTVGNATAVAVFTLTPSHINCAANLSVVARPPVLTTITVSVPPVFVGHTVTATASLLDQYGQPFSASVVWAATGGTVTQAGLFTGSAAGPGSVTATASGISGTSNFSITAVALVSINVTPLGPLSGLSGTTLLLTAAGTNNDGTTNPLTSLVWNSSNTGYVSVSGGLVSLHAPTNTQGQATVSASQSGITSNGVVITVNPTAPILTTIQVTPNPATLLTGKTLQFVAATLDQYGNPIAGSLTWSATGNLTISSTGLATAGSCLGASSATVTATSSSVTGSATVNITPAPSVLTTVTIAPGTATINVGSTQQMTATKRDQCNVIISAPTTWASSNSAATVSVSGLVSGVFQGTTNITATAGGVTSPAATVNVNDVPPPPNAVASIQVTPPSSTIIATTQTVQLLATAFNATGQVVPATMTWSSSSPGIATVDQTGVVSGVSSSGTVQIVASTETEGVNGTTVTVTSTAAIVNVSSAPALKTITITPISISLPQFSTQQFSAFGKDQYGNPISASFSWASNNGVCQIDGQGLLTAALPGSCLVSASSGGIVSPAATVNVSTVFSLQGPWEFTTNTGYSVELDLTQPALPGPVALVAGKLFDASFGRPVDSSGNFLPDFWYGNVVAFSGSNQSNAVSLSVANSQGFGISITGTLSSNTAFSGNYVISSPSGPISGSVTGTTIGPPTTGSGGWLASGGIFNPVSAGGCGIVHIFLPNQIGPFDWSGSDTCAAISDANQIGAYVHFISGSFSFAGHMSGATMTIEDDACYTVSNQSQCGAGGTMTR